VRVGGKRAKVKSWTDTEIVAQLHKKTPTGDQPLLVTNKVGDASFADGTISVGGGGGGAKSTLRGRFDRDTVRADGDDIEIVASGQGYVLTIAAVAGRDDATVVIDLSNLDLSGGGPLNNVEPAEVRYTLGSTTWAALSGSGAVSARVTFRGDVIEVEFDGELARTAGSAGPDPLDVRGGALDFTRP
jgi:hypothetical protein